MQITLGVFYPPVGAVGELKYTVSACMGYCLSSLATYASTYTQMRSERVSLPTEWFFVDTILS